MMHLVALTALFALAQGEPIETEVVKTTKKERLAQDVASLQLSLNRKGEERLHAWMRARSRLYLNAQEERPFAPSTVGGVRYRELSFCHNWNSPSADWLDKIPAEDFENPSKLPELLVAHNREFKELGIEFLVVPIPLRLQVYPEHLEGIPRQEDFLGYGMGMTGTLLYLARNGVEVVNLLPVFASNRNSESKEDDARLFLDYDTHWTPRGCRLAADQIAMRIQSCDWFTQGPDTAGEDFFVQKRKGVWRVPMNRTSTVAAARRPEQVWYEQVVDKLGRPAHVKDEASSVLLIGDSQSRIYGDRGADLASLLYARLGHRLDLIRINGGGPALWKSLARRGEKGVDGKLLVIWLCSTFDFEQRCDPQPLFR